MPFRKKNDTLLVVVDMQEGFRYPSVEKIVKKVNALIVAYDQNVVFLEFENHKRSWFEKTLNWKKFQNKKDRKLLKEIHYSNQPIFTHQSYDIFTPELLRFLKRKRVERIVLCGVYTDVCIQMAALKAFDMELPVAVVEDACASQHGQELHQATIQSLKYSIGKEHVLFSKYLLDYPPNNKGPNATSNTTRMR